MSREITPPNPDPTHEHHSMQDDFDKHLGGAMTALTHGKIIQARRRIEIAQQFPQHITEKDTDILHTLDTSTAIIVGAEVDSDAANPQTMDDDVFKATLMGAAGIVDRDTKPSAVMGVRNRREHLENIARYIDHAFTTIPLETQEDADRCMALRRIQYKLRHLNEVNSEVVRDEINKWLNIEHTPKSFTSKLRAMGSNALSDFKSSSE